ncbi:alpha-beta hydrolase superfamily lysophospholipase [Lysinibacillus composti]|nr:alpha/beta hydrolase [Lysinibacillus composti]MBM7608848.1 alpha-beta hydrolase superfamily lysophospholipase [Lysinibacillus composti]
MKKQTKVLAMSDGHQIFIRFFVPEGEPIGNFHILHGMAEHSARYDAYASLLCEQGYFVTVHDHRGHGKTVELNGSYGYLADENGFDRIVEDVYEIVQYIRNEKENVPTILFGHSMGSFMARRFIQLYSDMVDRCILCGTGATTILHRMGNSLAKTLARVEGKNVESKLMSDLSFGSFNKKFKNAKTPFDWLCANVHEVKKYIDDPLCGFIPTHQFFVDLTDGLLLINRTSEIAQIRKDLPVLLISGSDDPVGDKGIGVFKVAKQLENAGLEDVVVYLFEGMRHEILNEKNNQYVYEVTTRWLEHDRRKN